MPNISDHIWNNMIFIKYARKLNLTTVYYDYLAKFNSSISELENFYPIEIFMKNMEHFKFIRKVSKNYAEGLKIAEDLCAKYSSSALNQINSLSSSSNSNNNLNMPGQPQRSEFSEREEIDNQINASYLGMKGYFLYKTGKIKDAHDCFVKSVNLNQTDYKLYADWAEISENVLYTLKGTKLENIWFENTLINNFMTIVFKLDKAKYLIPKVFFLIKKFPNQIMGSMYDKYLENIPTWVWLFWIPQVYELLKTMLTTPQNTFIINILKKLAVQYPQNIYYQLNILLNTNLKDIYNLHNSKEEEIIKQNLQEIKKLIHESDKQNDSIKKIDIILDETIKKMERFLDDIILNHLTHFLNFRNIKKIEDAVTLLKKYFAQLKHISANFRGEYINRIFEEFENLFKAGRFDLFDLYEKIKNWRYFIISKRATRTNFRDIHQVLDKNLCNMNFEEVEIPGYFTNKIQEPTQDNKVFISRFESEFNFKFINFANKKLIIRGMNEKLYSFKIVDEIYGKDNSDTKIAQMQVLLNHVFASNKDTYKGNIKFNLPIRFQLTNVYKIVQEESSYYYLDELYDFCMQKMGFDPEIYYRIYHEEFKKLYPDKPCESLEQPRIIEKVYYRMCEILPIYKLKNFIHKFIINCDEIFIFRKQFATSYALNSLMSNIFRVQDELYLDKISFNKETGSVTFHSMKYFKPENLNALNFNTITNNASTNTGSSTSVNLTGAIAPLSGKKEMIPLRLSRNIYVIIISFT